MTVLLSEHRHHIQVPPRRSTDVKDVCGSETIPDAQHEEVTQNNEVDYGCAHRRERDSVCVYDIEYGVFILAGVNAQVSPSPLLPSTFLFLLD
jgi:hypothetical protein